MWNIKDTEQYSGKKYCKMVMVKDKEFKNVFSLNERNSSQQIDNLILKCDGCDDKYPLHFRYTTKMIKERIFNEVTTDKDVRKSYDYMINNINDANVKILKIKLVTELEQIPYYKMDYNKEEDVLNLLSQLDKIHSIHYSISFMYMTPERKIVVTDKIKII